MLPTLARSTVALGLAAVCSGGAPLAGQARVEGRERPVWTLEGLRAGHCVRFLIAPGVAQKNLREGFRILPAGPDRTLHPALRSVVDAQPEVASWAASALCVYYLDAVHIGRRRYAERDPRKGQMLGIWTLATAERATGTRRDLVLDLFATGRALVEAAGRSQVKLRQARSTVSRADEDGNDLYDVRIGKTHLVWNGRAIGDSTRIERPVGVSWLVRGTSGMTWDVHATLRPAWSRPLVGVLRVEGKDGLAKSLKASPIRFVGPLYQRGSGELIFSR